MVNGAYDDPQVAVTREVMLPAPAAGAAGTTKFALYADAVVSRARAVVKTAGTSATSGSYIQVLTGTTTLGTLLTGSATAGTVIDATLTGSVPAGSIIQLLQGTDATGVVYGVALEYKDSTA